MIAAGMLARFKISSGLIRINDASQLLTNKEVRSGSRWMMSMGQSEGYAKVRARLIVYGLWLLIAAALSALSAAPASAHPDHRQGTLVLTAVSAFEPPVYLTDVTGMRPGARMIAAQAFVSSSSCCEQNSCSTGCGPCSGMACGAGSCCHGGGMVVITDIACVAPSATVTLICHSGQVLAGVALGPGERPPSA